LTQGEILQGGIADAEIGGQTEKAKERTKQRDHGI